MTLHCATSAPRSCPVPNLAMATPLALVHLSAASNEVLLFSIFVVHLAALKGTTCIGDFRGKLIWRTSC